MTLLFDIGNSRIKWQQSESFREKPSSFNYNQDEIGEQLKINLAVCGNPNQDVIIVSVAGEQVNSQIEKYITEKWGVGARFLSSESEWKTLHNGYKTPESLGVDRWFALIGAMHKYSFPFVVCDIGTAVTIDIVDSNGRHLGGYIIPGLDLMVGSLNKGTNINVSHMKLEDGSGSIPTDTYSGIKQGCLQAIVSMIDSIMNQIKASHTCILTGGGAEQIAGKLSTESKVENNLVFYGIRTVIETDHDTNRPIS